MATAKTGSFYLTETIQLAAAAGSGSRVQGTVDLSSYVSVPSSLAVAIDQVDIIYQNGTHYGGDVGNMTAANGALSIQVTDLNPGTVFVRADSQSLVASGSMNIDHTNDIATHVSDLYPDAYGPSGLSDAFLVVNDTLYVVGGNDGTAIGAAAVSITVRIRARIVKLSSKDWMAIAIQSTAE